MSQDQQLQRALDTLENMLRHFTRTPSSIKDSDHRARSHEAIKTLRAALTATQRAGELSNSVLAALDALGDDAAVHIFPDDLDKCGRSECVVEVCSVRAGSPTHGKTVPLFSREQVATALIDAAAQQEQPPDDERDAETELNCAEEVLDAISVDLNMEQTAFDCIGDYITAVVEAIKKQPTASKPEAQPDEQLRLEDIAAMRDELAKIAVAVGRSKADGHDCDWFELAVDVAALAAGVPKGWDMYRLNNSDETLVVSPPDGSGLALNPQGLGLASQLLYQLATTLMGGQTS